MFLFVESRTSDLDGTTVNRIGRSGVFTHIPCAFRRSRSVSPIWCRSVRSEATQGSH